MFKKFAQCLLLGVFVAALNGCATTDDAGSLVEDPLNGGSTGSEDGILEDGAVIVGENYDSYNDGLHLTDVQRAKLQALKQDNIIYFAFSPVLYRILKKAHAALHLIWQCLLNRIIKHIPDSCVFNIDIERTKRILNETKIHIQGSSRWQMRYSLQI